MTQPGEGAQGGAGTDTSGQGTQDTDQQQTDSTGTATGTQSGAAAGQGSDAERGVTRAEFDQLRTQLQAADRSRQAAQDELRQLKDKDLPEIEKLKRDSEEAAKRAEEAEAALAETRIENAFLTDNTNDWVNPTTALKLLDRSKITIGSDGKVLGVQDAAAALAKSDAYLLKPKTADDGAANDGKPGGTIPANNGGGSGQPTKDQLGKRFSVLNTRR